MGYYKIGQVCLSGHEVTGDYEGGHEFRQDFCDKCGEPTIKACPDCNTPIKGFHEPDQSGDVFILSIPEFNAPRYCYACGKPFPWTQRYIAAAQELADELDELTDDEKRKLKDSIPELTRDTPRTELASVRFKKLVAKAGPVLGKAMREIVVSVATEAAKKSIGL